MTPRLQVNSKQTRDKRFPTLFSASSASPPFAVVRYLCPNLYQHCLFKSASEHPHKERVAPKSQGAYITGWHRKLWFPTGIRRSKHLIEEGFLTKRRIPREGAVYGCYSQLERLWMGCRISFTKGSTCSFKVRRKFGWGEHHPRTKATSSISKLSAISINVVSFPIPSV